VSEWTDQLIELRLWVRLSQAALSAGDHASVTRCTGYALQLACPDDQKHRFVLPTCLQYWSGCLFMHESVIFFYFLSNVTLFTKRERFRQGLRNCAEYAIALQLKLITL